MSRLRQPLTLTLPEGLRRALEEHCRRTGESPGHVLRAALADHLDLEHHTLWQVSTSTAVVEGVSQGCLRVGELNRHGDFGLGTFDHLDGEGVLLNGECWQARADGSLSRAPDDELTPFFVVTHFRSDQQHHFADVTSWSDLCERLDRLRPSDNLFLAIRVHGLLGRIEVRSVSAVESGTDLVSAAAAQSIFDHRDVSGTLVGFWSPSYASSLNIPGYHFHFLSDDRRCGGHVLENGALAARQLTVDLHLETDLRLALPQTRAFLEADLRRDPTAALHTAEGKPC
ncbi:MAG: acetolactate decarboxylase [Synechococcaceae cyanobacterium]|nr:acetolactate decarboxylase [Synechococcaceae cyanobacterium]